MSFKFVVATAVGQDMERVRGDRSQLWILELWGSRDQTFFIPHTAGKTFGGEKSFFLEAATLPSLIVPITSACGARNCPGTTPKSPSSTRRAERGCPGPGLPVTPSGPDLDPARQDTDANGVTTEGRMAGAWDRGRCPGEGLYSKCK